MNREREKQMAEFKRKHEEKLSTLPPELRKAIEQSDEKQRLK
jgi:hypothetical protein